MSYPNDQGNPAGAIPVWIANPPGTAARNIDAAGNTQVKTGAGVLLGISVNTGDTGATVAAYDGTSASDPKLGQWSAVGAGPITLPGGGLPFATGLFVVVAADPDVTILYK